MKSRDAGGHIVRQIGQQAHDPGAGTWELFDEVPVGLLFVDDDGRIFHANHALLALLGHELDACVGRHLGEIWGNGGCVDDALAALGRGERVRLDDASLIAADGTPRAVSIDASATEAGGSFSHSTWSVRPRSTSIEGDDEWWFSLLEAVPASVSVGGPDGEVRYWNRSFREYTGLTIEQARQSAWEIVHPDDLAAVSRLHAQAMSRQEPVEIEYRLRGKNGQWRWHLSRTTPIRDATGAVKYWLGVSTDIDDRRQAERALRESERRFRQIVETANEGMLVLDKHARVSYANERMAAMLGYTQEEIIGREAFDLTDVEMRPVLEEKLRRRRDGIAEQYDLRLRHRDGRNVHCIVSASPVMDLHGEYAGSLTMVTDVTRRVKAERTLNANLQLYRTIADLLPALIVLRDAEGRVRFCNRRMLEYAGVREDDVLGREWFGFVHPDEQAVVERWRASRRAGEPSVVEYRCGTRDGGWRWHLARIEPIRNARGEIEMWIGAHTDIHARKLAEETLSASEQRWRSLAEALPAMVAEASADGEIFYFNGRLREYTGLADDELRADPMAIVHPDDVERVRAFWEGALRSGQPAQMEWRVRKWNGEYCWHMGSVSPIRDARSEVVGWVGALLDVDQLKRSEATLQQAMNELEEAHARLQATFASSPNGLAVFDREGRFLRVNEALAAINGIPAEEHFGRTPGELVPEVWALVEPAFRDVVAGRVPFSRLEVTAPTPSTGGEERVWLETWFPIKTRRGEIIGVSAVVEDVTEHRQAEQAVRDSEQRFRQLADAMPQIVWTARPDGEVDYYNRRWYEFLGTDGAEHPGHDWRAVLHPDDQQRCIDAWRVSVESGEPYEIEYRFRDPRTGDYHWHLGRALPVRDASGAIVRWYGTSTDIHDQKEVQKRLSVRERQQESIANLGLAAMSEMPVEDLLELAVREVAAGLDVEYAKVLELQPDGASLLLRAGAGWSPEIAGTMVLPLEESEGGFALRTQQPVIVHDLRNESRFRPPDLLLDHGVTSGLTVIIHLRDGAYGTIGAHTQQRRAFTVDDLHFLQAIANLVGNAIERERDEISLQDTADRLRDAVAAKDEFLGLVSHELKTPITTIYGNAEVLHLRGEDLAPDVRQSATEDIRNEAERLHRIVDNLLVLARMERGQRADAEPVLVRRLVQAVVNEHMRRFPHRKITVYAEPSGYPIMGEPVYLEQIIRNLVSNAEKYSPADQPIEVHIDSEGDDLRVSVLDRGPGVPDEEAEEIFTPFYRSAETAARAGGIGIGLAVCKRLVEAQDGRMWARRRPDGGSDIGFALPIIREDEV